MSSAILLTFRCLALSYFAVVAAWLPMQIFFAHQFHNRRKNRSAASQTLPGKLPSVDVIVPCYNEDPVLLEACLRSIALQDYSGQISVYVVDDGSWNRPLLASVYKAFDRDPRFTVMLLERNVGKRRAQVAGIRASTGDLVLTVDSDTTIDREAVRTMVAEMSDQAVGAAMGRLVASNPASTWLTRLVHLRYWIACEQERAAQAHFGAVLCCSGPCAMYRRTALMAVLDKYETQLFRGRPSDFGEDRHLTTLMLSIGMQTRYVPEAEAATFVPERIRPYIRQQLRWSRSTYRDTLEVVSLGRRLPTYVMLDIIGQNLTPPLLGLTALAGVARVMLTRAPLPWVPVVGAMTLGILLCVYGWWRTKNVWFFTFIVYELLHLVLLIPLRAYAAASMGNSTWGSRSTATALADTTDAAVQKQPHVYSGGSTT
jgi:N-acetylglucosaminyltransferase